MHNAPPIPAGPVVLWQASPFTGQTMAGHSNAISNTTDPRSITTGDLQACAMDQGLVLAVRVFVVQNKHN